MIDELQAVRALRPSDPPDDPAARDGALRALRAAAPDAPGATCPPRRPRLGAVFVLAAALVALLVAGGALVLLHGRTPSRRVADSRGTGRIVTTDGTTLLTDRGGVLHATGHGALLAGTVSQYRRAVDAGETVRIGEDAKLERAAQTALIHSIEANRASAGAVVAMDPSTGQILALNLVAEHGDPALADPASVGSAFLPITALAGLGSGMISPGQSYDDVGRFCVSPRVCLRNSGGVAHGVIGISAALRFSDSDFFYNVGALLNSSARFGSWLQEWASALGLGRRTGIDLPGEAAGVIPAQVTTRRRWTMRDSAELAVGQGLSGSRRSSWPSPMRRSRTACECRRLTSPMRS
jgi:hypothetical protein